MSGKKQHDNTDRDIIIINKDSLALKLFQSKEFFNSLNSAFGFGGVALALLSAGYLTETFRNVGNIPGETIRAVFIALGLIFIGFTINSLWAWFKLKDTHEPTQIVFGLLKQEPTNIVAIITPKEKNRGRKALTQ